MARKPRVEYAGAVYHVMNRGDRGEPVFKDKLDYELFLIAASEVCERTGWRIHAWLSQRLHMGHPQNLSLYIRQARVIPTPLLGSGRKA